MQTIIWKYGTHHFEDSCMQNNYFEVWNTSFLKTVACKTKILRYGTYHFLCTVVCKTIILKYGTCNTTILMTNRNMCADRIHARMHARIHAQVTGDKFLNAKILNAKILSAWYIYIHIYYILYTYIYILE